MAIDPVEFGQLKGMVEATLSNSEKLLDKFDDQLDDHERRITTIEAFEAAAEKSTGKMYAKVGVISAIVGGSVSLIKGIFV